MMRENRSVVVFFKNLIASVANCRHSSSGTPAKCHKCEMQRWMCKLFVKDFCVSQREECAHALAADIERPTLCLSWSHPVVLKRVATSDTFAQFGVRAQSSHDQRDIFTLSGSGAVFLQEVH